MAFQHFLSERMSGLNRSPGKVINLYLCGISGPESQEVELLQRVKARVGSNFPVMVRYGLKSYMKGIHQGLLPNEDAPEAGQDIEEGIVVAKILEDAGYDAFNADGGVYDSWYWAHPPICCCYHHT